MIITVLNTKKRVCSFATLRKMKPEMTHHFPTELVKTNTLRMVASKLKKEGYLFRVTTKGLNKETIVQCIKTPKL